MTYAINPGVAQRSVSGIGQVAALLGALSAACSSQTHSTPGSDAGAALPMGTVSCATDPRVDAFRAGLTKRGLAAALSFEILGAEPSPPAKGNTTLTLAISDTAGLPFEGHLEVTAKMPDHGHPSPVVPVVNFDPDQAQYSISPLDFFMAGVWQVTLSAATDSSAGDAPVDSCSFYFCIEG